ncbi:MAG: hypothetical protein LBI02_11025 [Opitutaceae bacterium]|nr:hypothetical protein [Opitutaceae bacterium]
MRGQRVYCSNRNRRGGCGRTFAICLAEALPRHGVDAAALSRLLAALLAGQSLKAAAEAVRTPFALETFYHLCARMRRRLDALRVLLCRDTAPPACVSADAFPQTLAHLRATFLAANPGADMSGMCAWFQMRFQRPFLG